MTLCRPVYQRASLIAFSFASAPPFVKKDIWRSPGVISASMRASVERGSVAIGGPVVDNFSACSLVAAAALRGWGPIETVARCGAKAGEGLPFQVPKERAFPPATGEWV